MAETRKLAIYSPKQIAEMFGISASTVRDEIRNGRLKAGRKRGQKRGYWVKRADLDAWADGDCLEPFDPSGKESE